MKNNLIPAIVAFLFFIPILVMQLYWINSPIFWDDQFLLTFDGFKSFNAFLDSGFKNHPIGDNFFRPIMNFSIFLTNQIEPVIMYSRIFNLVFIFLWIFLIIKAYFLISKEYDLEQQYVYFIIGFSAFHELLAPISSWSAARGDLLASVFILLSALFIFSNFNKFTSLTFGIFFAVLAALSKDLTSIVLIFLGISLWFVDRKKSYLALTIGSASILIWGILRFIFKESPLTSVNISFNSIDFYLTFTWNIIDIYTQYFKITFWFLSPENTFKTHLEPSFLNIFYSIFAFSFTFFLLYGLIVKRKIYFALMLVHFIYIAFLAVIYEINWHEFEMAVFDRYLIPTIPLFYFGFFYFFMDSIKNKTSKKIKTLTLILSFSMIPALYFQMMYWSNPDLFWKTAQNYNKSSYASVGRVINLMKTITLDNNFYFNNDVSIFNDLLVNDVFFSNYKTAIHYISSGKLQKISAELDFVLFFALLYEHKNNMSYKKIQDFAAKNNFSPSLLFWNSIFNIEQNKCVNAAQINSERIELLNNTNIKSNNSFIYVQLYQNQSLLFKWYYNAKCK